MNESKALQNGGREAAHEALALADGILERIWAYLWERSERDGRLSDDEFDRHQVAAFDAAHSAAELAAARFFLNHVDRLSEKRGNGRPEPSLEERLALLFTAEIVQNVRSRLSARPADYGLRRENIRSLLFSDALDAFVSRELSTENMTRIGRLVGEFEGRTGEDLLDEERRMMRDTFRRFANDVVAPLAERIHREDRLIPSEILGPLKEMGCFGLSIPARYGGLTSDEHEDNMGMIVVTEELSRGSLGAAGSLITRPEIMARALLAGGTEEQKSAWLPKLAAGEPLCAVAVTEPDFGSDVAGMKFKATKTDGGWRLNGAKTWCTFGAKAGVLLVLARTVMDPKAGHRGLSVFLVEKPSFDGHEFEYEQPGGGRLSGRAIPTIGYRGMHSYDLFFEDYFVNDDTLLGGESGLGKGFYAIMAGFSGGRIQTAARAVGVMQSAFEKALRYASERKVFGRPIGEYPLNRAKLARMAAHLMAARQFTYAVAGLMDEGRGEMEASMVKLFASKTAEWLTREAMQIHGGMGYAEEVEVSRLFLDARVLSIFEGVEETLALKVIARALVAGQSGKGRT